MKIKDQKEFRDALVKLLAEAARQSIIIDTIRLPIYWTNKMQGAFVGGDIVLGIKIADAKEIQIL